MEYGHTGNFLLYVGVTELQEVFDDAWRTPTTRRCGWLF